MRVAIFVGSFPVASETFIVRHVTGLLDLGHDVEIFANARGADDVVHPAITRYGLLERTHYVDGPAASCYWEMPVWPPTGQAWTPDGQPSRNLAVFGRALGPAIVGSIRAPRTLRRVLSQNHYGFQANSLSGVFRLATILKAGNKFDVLHAHFGPVANSFLFARQLWGRPLVVTFHGYDFTRWPREMGGEVYNRLFAEADAFTVGSLFARRCVSALGCPLDKIHVIPMGVDLSEFSFRERRRDKTKPVKLLTVARLVPIKGLEFSIHAVARLRGRHDVVYDIVGEGPERAHLQHVVTELHVEDIVRFHGARDETYVRQVMDAADIFLLTSVAIDGDQEGQGLALQEAQACGLPVIATHHGGLPEGLLEGRSGMLVPEGDIDALVAALEHLIGNPDLSTTYGREGRAYIESRFAAGAVVRAVGQLYQQIAG